MQRVEASTRIYAPRETVYDFVRDFPGYADYSGYLRRVEHWAADDRWGYDIEVALSVLSYTARSEVTALSPPERIDWRLTRDIDAEGYWHLAPATDAAPDDVDDASDVTLVVDYDPSSVTPGSVGLPRLLSLDALVDRVVPHVQREAETVLERIVRDLEDQRRPVDLEVWTGPAERRR